MLKIEMLSAYEGDSIWVEYGNPTRSNYLVIDAGRKETYRELVDRVAGLGQRVELFVMTHIDDDHIFGAVPLFADGRVNNTTFKDVWYNGYSHLDPAVAQKPKADVLGPKKGEFLAALLLEDSHPWNEAIDKGGTVVIPDTGVLPSFALADEMRLTLLSPTWDGLSALKSYWERNLDDIDPNDPEAAMELFSHQSRLQPDVLGDSKDIDVEALVADTYTSDDSEPNGSTIAFLAEYDSHAVLFTGDAHPPVLEQSIGRLLSERGQDVLELDAFKVSHHGSKSNTSTRLLELVKCRRFLISTNGSRHHHPDREAIARILHRNHKASLPTELFFNYETPENKIWDNEDLKREWNYTTHYPPAGSLINL